MGTGVKNKKIDLSCIRSDGFALYKDGKIWTEAFCRALNEYAEIYIPAGKYYIEEIKAPAGYKLNKNKIYFEVDDENEFKYEGEIPVLEININNEKEKEEVVPKTGISFIEKDIYILEEDKRKIKLTK